MSRRACFALRLWSWRCSCGELVQGSDKRTRLGAGRLRLGRSSSRAASAHEDEGLNGSRPDASADLLTTLRQREQAKAAGRRS